MAAHVQLLHVVHDGRSVEGLLGKETKPLVSTWCCQDTLSPQVAPGTALWALTVWDGHIPAVNSAFSIECKLLMLLEFPHEENGEQLGMAPCPLLCW